MTWFVPARSLTRLSPALAGSLYGSAGRGIVGQLLAATIDGDVRLRPGDDDVLVELVSWPTGLSREADEALSVLVPRSPSRPQTLSGRLTLATDETLARVRDAAIRARLVEREDTTRADHLLTGGSVVAAAGIPWFAHSTGLGFAVGATTLAAVLGSVGVGWGLIHARRAWTPQGTDTLGYLEGVTHYLASAQTDRIVFLQSATVGSHRVTAEEEADVYERLLPYAVVLGVEDVWLATADALGISDRPWVPEGGLSAVIDAVSGADLAERLDARIDPLPGTSPRSPAVPTAQGNLWLGAGGGGLGGGGGGSTP